MKTTEEKIERVRVDIESLAKKLREKKETLKSLEKTLRQEKAEEGKRRAEQILTEIEGSRGELTDEVFNQVISLLRSGLKDSENGSKETVETEITNFSQNNAESYY